MEFTTAMVLIALIAATVVVIGIYSMRAGASQERKIKHEEFKASLEPTHRERMASLAATRDAEIAKYTQKAPAPTLEGEGTRRIGSE